MQLILVRIIYLAWVAQLSATPKQPAKMSPCPPQRRGEPRACMSSTSSPTDSTSTAPFLRTATPPSAMLNARTCRSSSSVGPILALVHVLTATCTALALALVSSQLSLGVELVSRRVSCVTPLLRVNPSDVVFPLRKGYVLASGTGGCSSAIRLVAKSIYRGSCAESLPIAE